MIVKDLKVGVIRIGGEEYISLTDLARYADNTEPRLPIRDWMRNKSSFLFYSLWEKLYNPNFNSVESDGIKINELPYNVITK